MTEDEKKVQKALGTLQNYRWTFSVTVQMYDDICLRVHGYDEEDAIKAATEFLKIDFKNKHKTFEIKSFRIIEKDKLTDFSI